MLVNHKHKILEFNKTHPEQCRRQSKRSEGALAESGGGEALKQTELLHIKTDKSCTATNMHNFNNSVFMSKKREIYRAGSVS